MVEMTIEISEEMKEFVECQTAKRGYDSEAEFLRELIRKEQRRDTRAELEALILEGLQSEPIVTTPSEFLAQQRARLEARVKAGQVKSVNP